MKKKYLYIAIMIISGLLANSLLTDNAKDHIINSKHVSIVKSNDLLKLSHNNSEYNSLKSQFIVVDNQTIAMYQNETFDEKIRVIDSLGNLVNYTSINLIGNISHISHLMLYNIEGSNGNYTLSLEPSYLETVPSGIYNITIECLTPGYYNASVTLFLHLKSYDLYCPHISIIKPTNKQIIKSNSLTVEYIIEDDFQIREVSTSIGGKTLDVIGTGIILSPENPWGNSTYIHRSVDLAIPSGLSGEIKLVVNATDYDFHSTMKDLSIIVDTKPPSIAIIKPSDKASLNDTTFILEWSASDNVAISYYEVYVEEKLIKRTTSNSIKIKLNYDESIYYYDIDVYAFDEAGNSNYAHIRVHLDLNHSGPVTYDKGMAPWQIILIIGISAIVFYKLFKLIKGTKNKKTRQIQRRKGVINKNKRRKVTASAKNRRKKVKKYVSDITKK